MSGPGAGSAAGKRETRGLAALALAGVAVTVACHVAWIDEPFDRSLGHVISAGYLGYAERAFDAHGVLPLQGQWSLFFHPSAPEVHRGYLNHPPLPLLVYRAGWLAFGRNEASLRITSLALWLVFVAAFARVTSRLAGTAAGAIAVVLVSTAPTALEYGNLVCPPLFALPWMMLATAAFCGGGGPPTRARLGWYFLWAFVAALFDWNAYGLVAGLWVWILLLPVRPARPWRLAFLAGLPFGAGILVYAGWCVWASGGFGPFLDHLDNVRSMLEAYTHTFGTWWWATGVYFDHNYGWPLNVLAGLGLVLVLVRLRGRSTSAFDRLTLSMVVAGVVPCAIFWSRTGTHEFWILLLAPSMALLAARTLLTLRAFLMRRGLPGPAVALAGLVLVAAFGTWSGIGLHAKYRTDILRDRGRCLDDLVARGVLDPADVVLFPDYDSMFASRFYTSVPVIPQVWHPRMFDRVMKYLHPGREEIGRIWMAIPASIFTEHPWVADPVDGLPFVFGTQRPAEPFAVEHLSLMAVDKEKSFARRER